MLRDASFGKSSDCYKRRVGTLSRLEEGGENNGAEFSEKWPEMK